MLALALGACGDDEPSEVTTADTESSPAVASVEPSAEPAPDGSAPAAANARTPASNTTLTPDSYTNPFFGFTLPLPSGWTASAGSAEESGAEENSYMLLTLSLHDPKSGTTESNPTLTLVGERVTGEEKTGADFMRSVTQFIASQSQIPYSIGENTTTIVGGKTFDEQRFSLPGPDGTLEQSYLVRIDKGFALVIALAYQGETEQAALLTILDSLRFDETQ